MKLVFKRLLIGLFLPVLIPLSLIYAVGFVAEFIWEDLIS